MAPTKIATCCYCGTRAALVLRGEVRHELSCASCGAPLHALKMLRSEHPGRTVLVKPTSGPVDGASRKPPRPAPPRRKPRTRFGRTLLKEAFDLIEDIFD